MNFIGQRIAGSVSNRHSFLKMLLITGGAGFIGSNFVVDWLQARDGAESLF